MIPNTDNVTMPLDTVAPSSIMESDACHPKPISQLSRVPAYTPAPGIGIATKTARPNSPYLLISGNPLILILSNGFVEERPFDKSTGVQLV